MVIAKIMVPVLLVVQIADAFGLIALTGKLLGPVMALFNLPAEAGIVWATTMLTGIYGGLASLASLSGDLNLTNAQLSALSAMMLICHNIPIEQTIVRRAGASFKVTGLLRFGTAAVYGAITSWVCYAVGWLDAPVDLGWMRGEFGAQSTQNQYITLLQSTIFALVVTFCVIVVLVIALDALDKLGITKRFTAAISPLLQLSGLNPKAAPVTTVGVLLGLSYGGALIIEESHKQGFSARTRLLALSWLSLSHSLIEDTLLLAALGTNLWIILVGRVLITLLVIAALARITKLPD